MRQPGAGEIALRMRTLRHQRRWTGMELSIRTDVAGFQIPRSIITNLENGRRDMVTVAELTVLAKVFNVHVNWLATGEGPACTFCQDAAPEGYICKTCGQEAGGWNPTPGV